VYYNQNSKESNKIALSDKMYEFIRKNYTALKNNNYEKITDIEFDINGDKDLYAGIQHCKILNPKITSDGYFEATIIDYYDFEYRPIDIKQDSPKSMASKAINNWAILCRKKGF